MTNRSLYSSREVRAQVLATRMEEGMGESMEQLADVVRALLT